MHFNSDDQADAFFSIFQDLLHLEKSGKVVVMNDFILPSGRHHADIHFKCKDIANAQPLKDLLKESFGLYEKESSPIFFPNRHKNFAPSPEQKFVCGSHVNFVELAKSLGKEAPASAAAAASVGENSPAGVAKQPSASQASPSRAASLAP